jgi:riboflavin synthase
MFTGIVEEYAPVVAVSEPQGECVTVGIDLAGLSKGLKIGDSVAVNGVCLTVIRKRRSVVSFDVMEETLRRTNLGKLKKNSKVNIERSLRLSDRIGGHLVTGHIDGIGKVTKLDYLDDGSVQMWVEVSAGLGAMMISKGAVAVDGVSLTLVDVTDRAFSVCLIPHTLTKTTLGHVRSGTVLNVEVDFFAKYVKKFIQELRLPA